MPRADTQRPFVHLDNTDRLLRRCHESIGARGQSPVHRSVPTIRTNVLLWRIWGASLAIGSLRLRYALLGVHAQRPGYPLDRSRQTPVFSYFSHYPPRLSEKSSTAHARKPSAKRRMSSANRCWSSGNQSAIDASISARWTARTRSSASRPLALRYTRLALPSDGSGRRSTRPGRSAPWTWRLTVDRSAWRTSARSDSRKDSASVSQFASQ
jgi:hypothetical protein